jgi:two-component system, sensor histidine kinase LadS
VCGLVVAVGVGLASLASAAAPADVVTDGAADGTPLTRRATILEDPDGRLRLDDVIRRQQGWQPGPESALSFGFSRSAYWVRWHIRHDGPNTTGLVLDLGNSRQDHVHWYVLDEKGALLVEAASGDRLPYAARLLSARQFALPLRLAPGQRVQVLVRLASQDGLYEAMPSMLYTEASFNATVERQDLVLSLYHGGLLALALYNLLLFAATRERAFGLYVGYMVSLLGWNVVFQGYPFKYVWPEATAFNNNVLTVCAAWAFGIFGFFTLEYLHLRQSTPGWVWRGVQALAWANMAVVVPAAMDFYALGAGIGQLTGLAMAVVALGAGVWLLVKGQRQARFFVLAFAALGVGAGAYILQVVGVVPVNAFTTWGLQVGSGFEALVLALGLADAMNTLKAQKLLAERRERQAQQALNTQLEHKVQERTRDLERANHRLHLLAVTDELTGAFNRRQFNDVCESLLARRERADPLALCMFDLDHFKRYNDRYGHQAGDHALQTAAGAVQQCLHRSEDALFRLGGEEFAVLFTAASEDKALALAEQFRAAIAGCRLEHADNPGGLLTASFGVALGPAGPGAPMTAAKLYAAADKALYAAKAQGRNRVAGVSPA